MHYCLHMKTHCYFIACCTLNAEVAGPLLSHVTLAFLKLLVDVSVATQLRCGGMFINRTTSTCPQSVPVKKILKSVSIWWRYGQSQSGMFFWDTVYSLHICCCTFTLQMSCTGLDWMKNYDADDTAMSSLVNTSSSSASLRCACDQQQRRCNDDSTDYCTTNSTVCISYSTAGVGKQVRVRAYTTPGSVVS